MCHRHLEAFQEAQRIQNTAYVRSLMYSTLNSALTCSNLAMIVIPIMSSMRRKGPSTVIKYHATETTTTTAAELDARSYPTATTTTGDDASATTISISVTTGTATATDASS